MVKIEVYKENSVESAEFKSGGKITLRDDKLSKSFLMESLDMP